MFCSGAIKKFPQRHGIPGTGSGNTVSYASQSKTFEGKEGNGSLGDSESRRDAASEAHSAEYYASLATAGVAGGVQRRLAAELFALLMFRADMMIAGREANRVPTRP